MTLFLICLALLLYIYCLFPLLLFLLSLFSKEKEHSKLVDKPMVSAIFSYVNEPFAIVSERIECLLSNGYEELEVIVVSDGESNLPLSELADKFAGRAVTILQSLADRGKTAAQNMAAKEAKGDILLFTDANTRFEKGAIEELVESLQSEDVGCTVGQLTYKGRGAEASYWSIENWLKIMESRFYSMLGANGAIYALHRRHFIELPPFALSDFVEPILILLFHDKKTVFVPSARAIEEVPRGYGTTFTRKGRIVLRALKSLPLIVPAINPLRNARLAFLMWSHKILRWSSAFLVFGLLGGLFLLPNFHPSVLYFLGLVVLTSFFLLIFGLEPPVLGLVAHFTVTLAALCWAFWAVFRGMDATSWRPSIKN